MTRMSKAEVARIVDSVGKALGASSHDGSFSNADFEEEIRKTAIPNPAWILASDFSYNKINAGPGPCEYNFFK